MDCSKRNVLSADAVWMGTMEGSGVYNGQTKRENIDL